MPHISLCENANALCAFQHFGRAMMKKYAHNFSHCIQFVRIIYCKGARARECARCEKTSYWIWSFVVSRPSIVVEVRLAFEPSTLIHNVMSQKWRLNVMRFIESPFILKNNFLYTFWMIDRFLKSFDYNGINPIPSAEWHEIMRLMDGNCTINCLRYDFNFPLNSISIVCFRHKVELSTLRVNNILSNIQKRYKMLVFGSPICFAEISG